MKSRTNVPFLVGLFSAISIIVAGLLLFDALDFKTSSQSSTFFGTILLVGVIFLIVIHTISITSLTRYLQLDHLTRLDGRDLFLDKLTNTINNANPMKDTFYVILLDLNKFKQINDTLSHDHGDDVLREIAKRIKHVVRNAVSIARVGGDEFAIIYKPNSDGDYHDLMKKIITAINAPLKIEDKVVYCGASAGIASYPENGKSEYEMMRCADVAMYAAKRTQQDYLKYRVDDDTFKITDLTLVGDIKTAILNEDFEVWVQPIKNLRTGEIVAVESLIRWNHHIRGIIPPDVFIPITESTGLIKQLTQYLIRTAIKNYKTLKQEGYDIAISINVSPNDITDQSMMTSIIRHLAKAQMPPSKLKLEVTETTIMHDRNASFQILVALESLGVRLSIDDFGTGHSSFTYLKDFPIHEIKLDRSFISDILVNKGAYSIVKSTIDLAHELDAITVAEGVESKEIQDELTNLGCDFLQGYFLAAPMPFDQFIEWLRNNNPKR